jgi:hypothetical protein
MNVCEEEHWFDDDASPPAPDERITLRALIAIVYPLCRSDETTRHPDIAEDILTPAQRCGDNEKLEVERLCTLFSFVLEYLGHAVLSALANYLASFESACVLKRFLESVEQLTDTLSDAYDASILEAFHVQLKKGLCDEPF